MGTLELIYPKETLNFTAIIPLPFSPLQLVATYLSGCLNHKPYKSTLTPLSFSSCQKVNPETKRSLQNISDCDHLLTLAGQHSVCPTPTVAPLDYCNSLAWCPTYTLDVTVCSSYRSPSQTPYSEPPRPPVHLRWPVGAVRSALPQFYSLISPSLCFSTPAVSETHQAVSAKDHCTCYFLCLI